MKYTIEEHERLQRKDETDHWDIPRSKWATHHADLLAEVKRLHENDPAIAAIEKSMTALQESERDTIADLQARLADAVETLNQIADEDTSWYQTELLATECLARISGGQK